MQTTTAAAKRAWGLSLSVLALSACATAAALLNTEALVADGFSQRLGEFRQPAAIVSTAQAKPVSVAQSEDFWLGHARIAGAQPVSWTKPLAVGDKVTISSGGDDRVLEVIEVRPVDPSATHIVSDTENVRLLVVTCRDAKIPDGAAIRFIIEADGAGLPLGVTKRQSAL